MGVRLGDLEPGEEFVLPWNRRGMVVRKTLLGDVEVILDDRRIGREALLSPNRLVFLTGVRSPRVEAVA